MVDHLAPFSLTPQQTGGYVGPERRRHGNPMTGWLSMMLNEIDYGLVLLDDEGQVLHVNHAARAELDAEHPLQIVGRSLRARRSEDVVELHEALQASSRRGLRRLLSLGEAGGRATVAVVPLPAMVPGMGSATLVTLSKRHVCEGLSAQWFARTHHLTQAETRVLELLCQGHAPTEVANINKVGIATVRSQISRIRDKTRTSSIRELVHMVALLPPMVNTLRSPLVTTV